MDDRRTEAGGQRAEEGSAAADARQGEPQASLRLDKDACNSPADDTADDDLPVSGVYPAHYAGRFSDEGAAKRYWDWQKVMWFIGQCVAPVFLSLTLDRAKWDRASIIERYRGLSKSMKRKLNFGDWQFMDVPRDLLILPVEEIAYRWQSLYVSLLLSRRLGITKWVRICEVQTKSGDGWMHWHILADLADTKWDVGPHGRHEHFLQLEGKPGVGFNETGWLYWRDKLGGGTFDVELIRNRAKCGSYVAKYVNKAWKAIPHWMGESNRGVRILGWSRLAGEMIGGYFGRPDRKPSRRLEHRPRAKRQPLFTRLARSGQSCRVIQDGRYLGTLPAPKWALEEFAQAEPGFLERTVRKYVDWQGQPVLKFGLKVAAAFAHNFRALEAKVSEFLVSHGLDDQIHEIYRRRLVDWTYSWERMEYERDGPACALIV